MVAPYRLHNLLHKVLTREHLAREGKRINPIAIMDGVNDLSDEDARLLWLWSVWKDGADWPAVDEMQDSVPCRDDLDRMLIQIFGYRN